MKQRFRQRYRLAFLGLAVLLIFLVIWNINSGSVDLSVGEILKIIFCRTGEETAYNIVWEIRLPRICAVIILGGALSVSGFLLQTFFGNPIAGPFVLGISSGAKLVVSLVMIFLLERSLTAGSTILILAAFIGSMISMGFVLLISKKVNRMSILVISGIMIGYICSAVTDFVVTFADDSNIVNLHNWSMGSFSGMSWENVTVMAGTVFVTLGAVFLMSKSISAYQLGEAYAQNLGVNIKRFRFLLILFSSILSACVTAFAGPISFVGIAVPHLVKNLLKTSKPILVIPACFLGGALFCLFCDLLARTLFSPTELSISSVTAVFGAPIVIYIMIKRQRQV
jgi:iron complex transport system permease protein